MGYNATLCATFQPKSGDGFDTFLVVDADTFRVVRVDCGAASLGAHSPWYTARRLEALPGGCGIREGIGPLLDRLGEGACWRLTRAHYTAEGAAYLIQIRVPRSCAQRSVSVAASEPPRRVPTAIGPAPPPDAWWISGWWSHVSPDSR